MHRRLIRFKNIEYDSETVAISVSDDSCTIGTMSNILDPDSFKAVKTTASTNVLDLMSYIWTLAQSRTDVVKFHNIPIASSKKEITSSLRQEVYIRFFFALDEVVRKQLIDTIGISPSTGTVTVHFENIYPVWDFNTVTTGLLKGKQMLNPVFMLEKDGEVFPFDQALNNGSLLIIGSQTGGITQALTAQARQLIAAGQNVIYLESFQNGKEPLFTAIERTYGITKLNTKDIVAFVFINFQQQISPDYGSILLNNILLDLQELLKSNSRLHIILGYRSDVLLNGIIREAFRDEHEAFHSLGYDHGRLMEYLSINGIQLPEDINIRELLFSNLDFLCEFCAKGNSIEQAMKTLSSEQISRLFRPKDSIKGNDLQIFSVVTSILFQHDLLKEDFISDFDDEVRSSIREEFGFELISFSDYRRTAIELNAINQDRWIAAAGCYYAALGAVYRLRGSQKEMILSKMEASLKHIIPDSTAVLTARLFIDQLGIDGQQKLDVILQPLDEECRILLVEIIGRLISYYEVIRNSKAFIAGKALMTVNCLRRYWEANPQRTELIILIVDTCYSMLQTRSALEKGDYIRICHEVRRQLEYVLESGVFDGDEPDMLAERSRAISNIGACCLALGEEAEGEEAREYFRSALQYHQKAAEIRFRLKKTESKFAYRYATSIANIGTTYYYLSDFEKSYEYQKTGYELRKKENYMVVQSCNRLAGVLLRTGDSFFRNKVDEMLPLLNDAAQIMLGKPEQYHEEILLLQENFIFFLERVKTDRELLCSHIFDLLSTASEIDELCFEEYARDHDRCRYLVLRKWLSPLEDLFMIFAASIRITMRVLSKSSPLQSSLIADSLELLDNRSSRSLSDAQYVNACAFILRSCFDYRGKKALVSRYIGEKPSSDGSYTLAKQYYKELFSAYHGDASFIPLSELKPESEFVRFLQDTSRQGIIDDDTALTNRENILKTVEAFRLLNPVEPEGAAEAKYLLICPLGASTNTNYYRTKAAYELYCQRLEAGRDSIIYALGSENTVSVSYDEFRKLAEKVFSFIPDRDQIETETDVIRFTLEQFSGRKMKRQSAIDVHSEHYQKDVACLYYKDDDFFIASFRKGLKEATVTQVRHALAKAGKLFASADNCAVCFVTTGIYRYYTLSRIHQALSEMDSQLPYRILLYGNEYVLRNTDSICKVLQEIKVAVECVLNFINHH